MYGNWPRIKKKKESNDVDREAVELIMQNMVNI